MHRWALVLALALSLFINKTAIGALGTRIATSTVLEMYTAPWCLVCARRPAQGDFVRCAGAGDARGSECAWDTQGDQSRRACVIWGCASHYHDRWP